MQDKHCDYDALLLMNEDDFSKSPSVKKSGNVMTSDQKKLGVNFVTLKKKNIENSALGIDQYYLKSLIIKKLNGLLSPSFE